MSESFKSELNERDLLLATLELPSQAREAFLDQACQGRGDMKARVLKLLHNADSAQSFMAAPAVDNSATIQMGAIDVGGQVGRYRLMEQVGEGGMGVVFVAEQTEPIARKVALKVIKPGMDSKSVIARFEAERQALAMMDHPNIAKVLDAGTTQERLPYFVMELVRGMAITNYCDQAKARIADRLKLFIDVCSAVQHAHQKGIIHRDLKPSNILVTLHDGKPVVKVIDFGVAKALHQPLTQHTIYTALNQVLGTPLYMSPEQLELSGLDIDTRTDIYSLGVLLYELISGTLPFERERLIKSGFDEMRRIIREEEPPRPSNRVTSLPKEKLSTVAETRGLDLRDLQKTIQSELDWITLKSLSKDRTRRYSSASEFAADIQRYLDDVPVLACPPSVLYSATKLIRKHRGLVLSATLLLASLVFGTLVSIGQAIRASKAEIEVENQLDKLIIEQSKTADALTAVRKSESQQRVLRLHAESASQKATESAENEKRQREIAESANREAKWNLYVSNLFAMQIALEEENFGRLKTLLKQSTPANGDIDFRGWEWYYLEQCANATSITLPLLEDEYSRLRVKFSPVNDELATFTPPHFIDIWDLKSLTRQRRFNCQHGTKNFCWSPNGKYIAMGTDSTQECVILDSENGEEIWKVGPFDRTAPDNIGIEIGGLAWSPDCRQIAIGNRFGDIAILDLQDRKTTVIHTTRNEDHLAEIAWHPKDDRILVGMRYGKRLIIDTKLAVKQELEIHCDKVGDAAAWSPSGLFLATSEGSHIRIASSDGKDLALLRGHASSVNDLTWLDDQHCLSASSDYSIRLWDVATKSPQQVWYPSDDPIYSVSISASKKHFATGSNHPVNIVSFERPQISLNQQLSLEQSLHGLLWAPDSSKLYASGIRKENNAFIGGSVLMDGLSLRPMNNIQSELSRSCAWIPNSRFVLHAVDGDQVILGDPRTKLGLQSLEVRSRVSTAAWSPSCQLVMTTAKDSGLILRDGKTGAVKHQWSANPPQAQARGRWSPSETRFLFSGGYPIMLHIDGRSSRFPNQQAWDNTVAWHPSERILAVGNDKGIICFHDSESLQPIQYLNGHVADIKELDFSPDGLRLASASSDGTVRLWDVATGRELIRSKSPNGTGFSHVSWSPDGQQLAATTESTVIMFGPATMAIAPTKPALATHGKVFKHFEQQGIANHFQREVASIGWRIPQRQLSQLLERCHRNGTDQLAEMLEKWFQLGLHSTETTEDYLTAFVHMVDGCLDDQLANRSCEVLVELLDKYSATMDKMLLFNWRNEILFAWAHRIAGTLDRSQMSQILSKAIEFEKQFAVEPSPSSQTWYRRISLETLLVDTEIQNYVTSLGNSEPAMNRDDFIRLLDGYRDFLKQVPIEVLPLSSPINAQAIRDQWIRNITVAELHRDHNPTFATEWIEILDRTIRRNAGNPVPYYELALSQLVLGDHKAYAATCKKLLREQGESITALGVWVACLAPTPLADYDPDLDATIQSAKLDAGDLGPLLYRMSQYVPAKGELMKLINAHTTNRPLIEELFFLAMTEAKLKNREAADEALQRANSQFEHYINDPKVAREISWDVLVTWRLLKAEATPIVRGAEDE